MEINTKRHGFNRVRIGEMVKVKYRPAIAWIFASLFSVRLK